MVAMWDEEVAIRWIDGTNGWKCRSNGWLDEDWEGLEMEQEPLQSVAGAPSF